MVGDNIPHIVSLLSDGDTYSRRAGVDSLTSLSKQSKLSYDPMASATDENCSQFSEAD